MAVTKALSMKKSFCNMNRHDFYMRLIFFVEIIVATLLAALISPIKGVICFGIWGVCFLFFAPRYFRQSSFGKRLALHLFWCAISCLLWGTGLLTPSIWTIYVLSRRPSLDMQLLVSAFRLAGLLFFYVILQRLVALIILSKIISNRDHN